MKPVTQKDEYGCGVACVSFIAKKPYLKTISVFGREKARKEGFYCRDLVNLLAESGFEYSYKYIKPRFMKKIYAEGTIVFIKRSKRYPAGHYLVRYKNSWMDPWINFNNNYGNIESAKSGFRKRLPGKPIYFIFPKV